MNSQIHLILYPLPFGLSSENRNSVFRESKNCAIERIWLGAMGDTNQITVIAVSREFLREKAFITAQHSKVGWAWTPSRHLQGHLNNVHKEGIEIILI